MNTADMIYLALIVPAVTAVAIPLFARNRNIREAVTLGGAALLFVLVVAVAGRLFTGDRTATAVHEVVHGLNIGFAIEPLGVLFALVASSLWIVNSVYSIGYMRAEDAPRQTSFYVCFAGAIAATIGIAFAANLFTLFLFYELLTLVTFPLVTHRGDSQAMAAGRTYILTLVGASTLLLLPAMAWTYSLTGTLDFRPDGILNTSITGPATAVLLALFVFGFAKAAVMPVHGWLPRAMVAPTPVSALLHAVAVVKAGVFAILKVVVYIFGTKTLANAGAAEWLIYVAGATIVIASAIALRQTEVKKLLAYSTISQLSYVVLGAALLTPVAIIGAAIHLAVHAVSKITLFFSAGAIQATHHVTAVSDLDGMGRKMPWTMGGFTIGALSMIGVPPTAGFLGKWFILVAAVGQRQWFAVGVIVVSTLLNAGYFLPIVYRAFRRPAKDGHAAPHGDHHGGGEARWPMVVSIGATAAATLLLFIFPDVPYRLGDLLAEGWRYDG